jgi:hypothetical protein
MPKYPGRIISATPPTVSTSSASGIWELEEVLQYENAGTWPFVQTNDPNFNQTVLLLPGDGTNGAQNNTFIGATYQPGEYAVSFDGSGDRLTLPVSQTPLLLGNSDFTFECWVYRVATGNHCLFLGQSNLSTAAGSSYGFFVGTSSSDLYIGSTSVSVTSPNPAAGQWHHVAWARTGGTFSSYLNGSRVSTNSTLGTSSVNNGSTTFPPAIGGFPNGLNPLNGYISNARLIKGSGGYDATQTTITVPTAPLTAVTGTSLLTCQSATIVDNSPNAFAITVNGDAAAFATSTLYPAVTRNGNTTQGSFSPFLVTNDKFSGYFDGSGDGLVTPSLNLSTTDFTFETWVYRTATKTQEAIFVGKTSGAFSVGFESSGTVIQISRYDVAYIAQISTTVPLNSWFHLAVSKASNLYRVFLNGVQVGSSVTNTSSLSAATYGIAEPVTGTSHLNGYISNLRLVIGTAVYTANFTPPTAPLTAITNTSLLTCQSNTFVDNSPNNFAITVNGDSRPTTFNPFAPNGDVWSNYFDGNGDYLTVPAGSAFAYGTGDFTVEGWFYSTATIPQYGATLFAQTVFGTNYFLVFLGDNTASNPPANRINFTFATSGSGTAVLSGATTWVQNTWNHFAVVRSSGSVTVYLNGVGGAPVSCTQDFTNTTYVPTIGRYTHTASNHFTGYLSNIRIVKGTAVYTANFTPPTTCLTAIPGTSLLTCQSNRFADSSVNNFAITRNGDVRVTGFSPFQPTAAYSPTVNGGSGYFDGSGDYLNLGGQSGFEFGTGDFTIEFWLYANSIANNPMLIDFRPANTTGNYITLYLLAAGTLRLDTNATNRISGGAIASSSWYHIALCRSGTSTRAFVSGAQVGSTYTDSTSYLVGSNRPFIAADSRTVGDNPLNGYISNVRILKGTALYTSNFTPPPGPLTAIPNTSLLLNFTNAGIFDATGKNDLETVGNVQIDTAVKKYGTGSIEFDGTGDILQTPTNPDLDFDGGNWTIELWANFNSSSPASMFFWAPVNHVSGFRRLQCYLSNVGQLAIAWFGTVVTTSSGLTWSANQWYHLAYVRNGNTWTIYRNGTSVASTTNTNSLQAASGYQIGQAMNGFIEDLRITKGIARYTANFTPPSAAFPLF